MLSPKGKRNQDQTNQNLNHIDDTYVFDPSRQIYAPKTYYHEKKRRRIPKILETWLPIMISALTLLLLWGTVVYTKRQWREVKREADASQCTAKAAQEQAGLMKQQLVGSLGAVVQSDWNWTPVVGINELWLLWKNTGHTNASNVQARFRIYKVLLPEKRATWESRVFTVPITDFPPNDTRQFPSSYRFSLSDKELEAFYDMRETIKIEGSFSYFNGFDPVPRPICFYRFMGKFKTSSFDGGFRPCESFDSDYRAMLDVKKSDEKKP